jgi:hypothetical protein
LPEPVERTKKKQEDLGGTGRRVKPGALQSVVQFVGPDPLGVWQLGQRSGVVAMLVCLGLAFTGV